MHPDYIARPYQIEDLAVLINDPRKGLFQEPGCGKTFIAAMFSQYIIDATKEKVVWTMPGGIMAKNLRDILFSTNLLPHEVAMVQGPPAKRAEIMQKKDVKVFLMSAQGYSNEWELLPKDVKHSFHDEIHLAYATHSSGRTEEWYRACKNKGAIVPMTGTIIKGRLDSAYPILHVLAPEYYGNDRAFLMHHAFFDENGKVCGWKNHDRLKEILKRKGIFRSFKSVYGEEKKVIQVERCQLGPKTKAVYKKLEEAGLIELTDSFIDAGEPGVASLRARQVLACPEIFEIKEVSGKDEALKVDIEDHLKSGERLAIFSVFHSEQLRIVELIKKLGGKVGLINGMVSNTDRQDIDARFNANDLQFVVASPATAGIGFNWGWLNTMVYTSVDYNDDSFIQSYRRGVRGVRSQPLLIKILLYDETIENRILHIIDRKSRDHNLVSPDIEILNLGRL